MMYHRYAHPEKSRKKALVLLPKSLRKQAYSYILKILQPKN